VYRCLYTSKDLSLSLELSLSRTLPGSKDGGILCRAFVITRMSKQDTLRKVSALISIGEDPLNAPVKTHS